MVLATALMSSCNGDYDDWAAPQGYDAEEAKNVSLTASDGATIDMNNVTGETVNLFSTTFEAPEGFTVTGYELEVGATEEDVDVLPSDANGSIAAAELVSWEMRPCVGNWPPFVAWPPTLPRPQVTSMPPGHCSENSPSDGQKACGEVRPFLLWKPRLTPL